MKCVAFHILSLTHISLDIIRLALVRMFC